MTDDIITRLRGPAPSIPAMRDAAEEISRLRQRVTALENVLTPFAEFHPSLLEWRTNLSPWVLQDAFPKDRPVLERRYPIDAKTGRICRLFVSDFDRAAKALEKK